MHHSILTSLLSMAVTSTLALVLATQPLQAAEIAGVKFSDSAQVDDQALLLNGLGIRYRTIIKVYAAGLYLPKKSQDDKEVLGMPGPKRIHAVMFRDVEGDVLGKLLVQGIKDNNSTTEVSRHLNSVIRLGQAFATRKKLASGDSFTIDFDTKTGPTLKVNDKAIGVSLGDPAFNAVLLRVWLGETPADHLLKKGMLNQPLENRP